MWDFKKGFLSILVITLVIGCKKNTPDNSSKTLLFKQTIDNIKKSEPVLLTFGDDNFTDKIVWVITPNTNTTIETIANNATIKFNGSGVYTVTASSGNVYAQYTITVNSIDYAIDYGTNFIMTASKLAGIKQNEPIAFTVHNSSSGNQISWAVSTSDPLNLSYTHHYSNSKRTEDAITFSGANGYATITASDGIYSQRRTVWISGDTIISGGSDTTNFLLGDKLLITPSVEQVSGVKKLVFTANTSRKYNCPTDKILSFNSNNDYQIDYSGVSISPTTCNTRSVASCINSFKNIQTGTHSFSINFGNRTYTGSFELGSDGKYVFNWPNSNEVTISPLSVK